MEKVIEQLLTDISARPLAPEIAYSEIPFLPWGS